MSDLDDVRKRMQKRRGTNKKPLNDDNFKRFYNFMVKFMVVILVVLVSMSYIKINPDSNIKKMILNDTNYKAVTSWISDNLFSFLPSDDVSVSSGVEYQHVKDDYYKNNSNEVLSIEAGCVIATGNDENHPLIYLVIQCHHYIINITISNFYIILALNYYISAQVFIITSLNI